MEKYILNETPLRTANNFGINNIEVVLDIPKYKSFENFNIYTENIEKIKVEVNQNKISENENKIGLERQTNYSVKIIIPENITIEEKIKLEFNFDEDNAFLVENIDILLEKNAKANFEIQYNSEERFSNFHNGQLNILLQENAKADIVVSNFNNNQSDNLYEMKNELIDNATLKYTIIEIGGKNKISNYYSKLIGENSENSLNVIYLGKENDVIDINYNMETYGKNSKAYINVQGALTDSAKKNFKGTIDFKEGSKKAIGKENENCILLSKQAKSKSLPMLLCHEEDVEGEHGVSSGKIDEAKLFYIMTKGISYDEARKLIIKANFNDIIKNINNNELENRINEKIDQI